MKTIFSPKDIKVGHLYQSCKIEGVFEGALYLGCMTPKYEKFLVVVQASVASSIGRMVLNENEKMWEAGFIQLEHVND